MLAVLVALSSRHPASLLGVDQLPVIKATAGAAVDVVLVTQQDELEATITLVPHTWRATHLQHATKHRVAQQTDVDQVKFANNNCLSSLAACIRLQMKATESQCAFGV